VWAVGFWGAVEEPSDASKQDYALDASKQDDLLSIPMSQRMVVDAGRLAHASVRLASWGLLVPC
jgi:hypothetical protein